MKCRVMYCLNVDLNVLPNPGPYNRCAPTYTTPTKLDMVNIWARNTNADVIIISESWLNKTILDKEISLTGYNVFRADRPKRGGGGS